MTYLIENAVTIAELAKVLRKSEAEALEHARGLASVGHDWANRPAVSAAEAHGLVTGQLALAAEGRQAHIDAQLDAERYIADRQTAWDEAWRTEYAKHEGKEAGGFQLLGRLRGGPEASARAREAAVKAVEKFEKRNPPPPTVSPLTGQLAGSEV